MTKIVESDDPGPLTRTHLRLRLAQGDHSHVRRLLAAIPDSEMTVDERQSIERRLAGDRHAGRLEPTDRLPDPAQAARATDLSETFRKTLGASGGRRQKIDRLRGWLQRLTVD
ncbi:MAG: hypothetical protein OEV00_08975 [Acidobacteriota bacterium]|nr:hypothetical protein [Acidobacteriota bacterium]MDH3785443.1 hypothetical protein [Acidobacteriota bacterium]